MWRAAAVCRRPAPSHWGRGSWHPLSAVCRSDRPGRHHSDRAVPYDPGRPTGFTIGRRVPGDAVSARRTDLERTRSTGSHEPSREASVPETAALEHGDPPGGRRRRGGGGRRFRCGPHGPAGAARRVGGVIRPGALRSASERFGDQGRVRPGHHGRTADRPRRRCRRSGAGRTARPAAGRPGHRLCQAPLLAALAPWRPGVDHGDPADARCHPVHSGGVGPTAWPGAGQLRSPRERRPISGGGRPVPERAAGAARHRRRHPGIRQGCRGDVAGDRCSPGVGEGGRPTAAP